MSEITMIAAEHLHEHPDNPRKKLGDLSELTKSIKTNGILQNLTVVPIKDQPGEYRVIIGHRRRAAGIIAEVKEFPCIISDMDERQQFITMLEENMQRQDLSIQEQAYGFQLMFDWGESIKDIAEKSGFAEQTVKHRLEIAKLSKKTLTEVARSDLQLTIKDYILLEKIKDVKRRERVLENLSGREYLQSAVSREVEAEKREAALAQLMPLLEAAGVKPAKKNEYLRWKTGYICILEIDRNKKLPDKLNLKDVQQGDKLYWEEYGTSVCIYKYDLESQKKEAQKKNSKEIKIEKARQQLRKITDSMCADVRSLMNQIYLGEISSTKEEPETIEKLWDWWMEHDDRGIYASTRYEITGKSRYSLGDDEKKLIDEKFKALPVSAQLLITFRDGMYSNGFETTDYEGQYRKKTGIKLMSRRDVLNYLYGFEWSDPEAGKVADGSHEAYMRGKGI